MRLPVGIMQASLEMVRSRIAQHFPSEAEVIAQVIEALNPTANALRQRRHRAKPVTQTSVTSNASNNASEALPEPSCASRAASESLSLPKSSEILGEEEKRDGEEKESVRATRNAPSNAARNAKVTPRSWRRCPSDWQPNAEHERIAAEHGKNFARELAMFRDHTFATAKTDADATFRNWLRRDVPGAARPVATGRPVRGAMAPVSAVPDRGRVDVRAVLDAMEKTV